MPARPRLLALVFVGASFAAVLALRSPESARGQDKAPKGKKAPADPAPADGEFSKFGIYEKTAPRPAAAKAVETALPLKPDGGLRIALIGNTLFEREQEYGHFEAMLQKRFPDKNLTVRNLAWAADEIGLQPRPANFADTEQHLTHEKADVIFAAFGFNESFAGEAGLPAFKKKLADYLAGLKTKAFNGKSAPRIVLVSPTANQNVKGVAAADRNNANIKLYADAMREVAAAQKVGFVDVFSATLEPAPELTINGSHLTDKGYALFAETLFKGTFAETPPETDKALRDAIIDKDRQFFRRFRPLNTFYYTGGRNKAYGYLDFLPAMRNFDRMVENRDARIHALAQGKNVPAKVDDSNVPPLPKTVQARGANEWLSAAKERQAFKVDPRFDVNLFAGEEQFPDIANPIQMRWDAKGRLWVSCSTTYPHVYPGNEPDDKIVILEDTDGDGKADTCTRVRRQAAHPAVVRIRRRRGVRLRAAEPDVPEGHRRRRQGRRPPHRAERVRHRGLAPRAARPDVDARRRADLPRVGVPPLAGRNALRPGAAAEQRVVPVRPAHAPVDQLRLLPQHQPVGRDLRRLGPARRQSPDLRRRLPRARPRVPAAAPGPEGHAGVLRRVRAPVRGQPGVPEGTPGRAHQGPVQADQPRRDPQVEGGAVRVRRGVRRRPAVLDQPELHPGGRAVRPPRRPVRVRLVQPGEGAHAVLPPRRAAGPALRPHLADHGEGPQVARPAEDRRRLDPGVARTAEAARVPRPGLGQAGTPRSRPGEGAGGPRQVGGGPEAERPAVPPPPDWKPCGRTVGSAR